MPSHFEDPPDDQDPILDNEPGTDDEGVISQMFGRATVPDGPPEETPLMGAGGKKIADKVKYIKVILDIGPTGERGYKGRVDPNTTVEGLYRRFGNGVYKLEACNYKHKVLNVREDVEIAINEGTPKAPTVGAPAEAGMANALAMFASMSEAHQMRQAELAADTQHNISAMAQSNAEQNAKMQEDRRIADERRFSAQLESDRERAREAKESQQTFFASMMAMQNATNQQTIAMMNASTDREREASKERAERESERRKEQASNDADPMALANMLIEGMKMGQGLADPPTESWVKAIESGGEMIGGLGQMFIAQQNAKAANGAPVVTPPPPAALPAPVTSVTSGPSPAQPAPQPGSQTAMQPAAPKRRKVPFSKESVVKTAQLQALLRKRGVTLETFLTDTLTTVNNLPLEQSQEMPVDAASAPQQSAHSDEPARALPAGSDRQPAPADALHQGLTEQQIPA